jgi:hypothetical protein
MADQAAAAFVGLINDFSLVAQAGTSLGLLVPKAGRPKEKRTAGHHAAETWPVVRGSGTPGPFVRG